MPTSQRKKISLNRKSFSCLLLCLSIILSDQFTKLLAVKGLYPGQSISIIKNIFHITLVFNPGTAFGILKNMTLFFILVSIFAIVFILYNIYIRPVESKSEILSLHLILAGAVGNLIDRLRYGFVIDFLDFRIWPVFNVADSAITCGAIILAISLFKKMDIKETRNQ